jgi:16S rRNA (guanine527-N7)-methyltransferase
MSSEIVDDHARAAILRYLDAVLEKNEELNLTAVRDRDEAIERHVEGSLAILPAIRSLGGGRVVDVGTGGGFPGVPLAVGEPSLRVELVEAREKKARAVAACIERAGLPAIPVHAERVETLAHGPLREAFDIAVARALAPLPTLLELTLPLVRVGGHLVAIKGERAREEIDASTRALRELRGEVIALTHGPSGAQLVVRKLGPTPAKYPRRPGEPKKNPL